MVGLFFLELVGFYFLLLCQPSGLVGFANGFASLFFPGPRLQFLVGLYATCALSWAGFLPATMIPGLGSLPTTGVSQDGLHSFSILVWLVGSLVCKFFGVGLLLWWFGWV